MSGFTVVLIDNQDPSEGDFVHVATYESSDQLVASLIGLSAELITAAQEIEAKDEPQSPIEMEKYLEEHAGLLYQVGCIIIDRDDERDDAPIVWEYLYNNLSTIHDRFARVIDEVEVEVFG